MKLVIIRHAEPDWAPGGHATTVPDLSVRGRDQAARIPDHPLVSERITDLWVSPMPRAQQTAEPIAAHLDMAPTTHEFLAEIGNPAEWEGKPQEYIDQVFRDLIDRPLDEWWEGFPGGESFRDFHRRVHDGFEHALAGIGVHRSSIHPELWEEELPDRTICIVAHQGTNALLLGLLLDLEVVPWEWERFACSHASVSLVSTAQVGRTRAFSLRAFSDVRHLPVEMITR